MIPLRDTNPTNKTPIVTITLIVLNILVYLYEWFISAEPAQMMAFFDQWAIIPGQLTANFAPEAITLFSAMFLHGSWVHLGGNMLYLWIFGDNIEDRMGRGRFIIFYLLGGLAASVAQIAIDPRSTVPNVGASGAIAGVLGGYLILYPSARILTLVFRVMTQVPAYIVLGFWFVLQLFQGIGSLGVMTDAQQGGVAFFAHIGGFVAGMVLVKPFLWGRGTQAEGPY
ncbi:MAG: rhomboid family intramembrane serine protease [Ardenticatenaceae bacterium]|nr:rhomboid family intramembrane serine protease [Ardenticatenaceae bacterium]